MSTHSTSAAGGAPSAERPGITLYRPLINRRSWSRRARRRWYALALLVMAQFVVILDVAIVNVALPTIKTPLHFSTPNLQYVFTAYAITFGGLLLLGGRLSDRLGRLRLFIAEWPCSPWPRC